MYTVHICTFVCVYCIYMRLNPYVCIHIHTHVYIYIFVYTCLYVFIYTHVYIYAYIYIYIYVYVYTLLGAIRPQRALTLATDASGACAGAAPANGWGASGCAEV